MTALGDASDALPKVELPCHIDVKLAGVAPGEPWQTINWDESPDWDFTSASHNVMVLAQVGMRSKGHER